MYISVKCQEKMSHKPSCEKIPPPKPEHPPGQAEISMREFLDFLRTAYQVTESVEDILRAEGLNEEVDWIKLKNSELAKPKTVSRQTSASELGTSY